MSGRALGWAKKPERVVRGREAKAALVFLADYADEAGFAWPAVDHLAAELMCSGRTVQRVLKVLVADGALVRLDVEDRANGRTRTSAYYFPIDGRPPSAAEIAAYERKVGGRVTQVSPWEGDTAVTGEGDTSVGGRVTLLSPLYEPSQELTGPEGPSAGAGAREALIRQMEAACPPRLLAVSSRPDYVAALDQLAEAGEDVSVLPGCIRRMALDPLFTGRKVPVALERWLLQGQWRGWLENPQLPLATPAGAVEAPPLAADPAVAEAWARTKAVLSDEMTEATFGAWIKPAQIGEAHGRLYVVALTGTAREWIRNNCWRKVERAWSGGLLASRALSLVSKTEFERVQSDAMRVEP